MTGNQITVFILYRRQIDKPGTDRQAEERNKMSEKENSTHPFLPLAIGFFGVAVPLYVSIFFAPDTLSKVCEFAGATVLVGLGILMARVKGKENAA